MNVLCDVESDGDEGLFGLREVGEVDGEEAIAAFSVSEGEGEGGDINVGGVHMLAAAKAIRPGPAYWWGPPWGPGGVYQDHDGQREHRE